ncbi:hypothetical protein [Acinetobacter terrestris]|uniref:hypothetical protein n=1 Tax=Acinetobacter terrestris TaxID=2529843 RepID=UPI00103E8470|nr:hypothetical protein [Acinetobacter terrestris]TCB55678.1 hypothetical protein E0H84_05840 [Acinetobacter terrestris]
MFVPIKQNKTGCFRSGTTVAIKMAFLIFMMIFVMGFWLRLLNSIYSRGQTQIQPDHDAMTLHDIFTGHIFQYIIFLNQPKEHLYA